MSTETLQNFYNDSDIISFRTRKKKLEKKNSFFISNITTNPIRVIINHFSSYHKNNMRQFKKKCNSSNCEQRKMCIEHQSYTSRVIKF